MSFLPPPALLGAPSTADFPGTGSILLTLSYTLKSSSLPAPFHHHLNVRRLSSWEKHPASNLQSTLVIILFFTAKLLETSLPSSLPSTNPGFVPHTQRNSHQHGLSCQTPPAHFRHPPLLLPQLPRPTHTPAFPCIWLTNLLPPPPSLLFKLLSLQPSGNQLRAGFLNLGVTDIRTT